MTHITHLDTFDTIDGRHWLYAEDAPDLRFEVVALLDAQGEETDHPDCAAGGVVKIAEECFKVFTFPTVH